jgi:hypothetical protein
MPAQVRPGEAASGSPSDKRLRREEKKRHSPMKKASFRLETRFFSFSIRTAAEDASPFRLSTNF